MAKAPPPILRSSSHGTGRKPPGTRIRNDEGNPAARNIGGAPFHRTTPFGEGRIRCPVVMAAHTIGATPGTDIMGDRPIGVFRSPTFSSLAKSSTKTRDLDRPIGVFRSPAFSPATPRASATPPGTSLLAVLSPHPRFPAPGRAIPFPGRRMLPFRPYLRREGARTRAVGNGVPAIDPGPGITPVTASHPNCPREHDAWPAGSCGTGGSRSRRSSPTTFPGRWDRGTPGSSKPLSRRPTTSARGCPGSGAAPTDGPGFQQQDPKAPVSGSHSTSFRKPPSVHQLASALAPAPSYTSTRS